MAAFLYICPISQAGQVFGLVDVKDLHCSAKKTSLLRQISALNGVMLYCL
jgi:hypothetical protein